MKLLRSSLAALALGALLASAQAAQITGTLDISGGATLDTNLLASATQVVSFQNVTVSAGGVTVGSVLDTFINPGDPVVMVASPWTFGAGQNDLWSVGGFTFDLMTSTTNPGNATFLNISGTGVISGNGFDPTPGLWAFSSQSPTGSGDNMNFSFSATTVATPTPDGGMTAVLLGFSLLGLGYASKRLRK